MKSVTSFTANNCEFTACRGRNGGVLNIEPGGSSSITFTNCNFHDNIGRSGASKNGTSGNFHGAVARFGGSGTTTFNTCSFTDNVAYNGGGAFHMNAACTVACNNCTFTNNDCMGGNSGGTLTQENGTYTLNDCTVTGGDAGASGGLIYMLKGTLNLNNSTVSNCKSGASAKPGGAIYVWSGGTSSGPVFINATGTTFSNNQTYTTNNDSDQGGAIKCNSGSNSSASTIVTLNLTDCVFSGNKAKRFGTAISLDQYCYLKANRCVFTGNQGASRGVVSYGNNTAVFFSNCAFYNNTLSDNSAWGATIHGGGAAAAACVNNCTFHNNGFTTGTPNDSCVEINGDTPILLVNNTVVSASPYLVRANGQSARFCNNILINTGTSSKIFHANTGTKTSGGHNVLSGTSGADDATDLTNVTSLTGGAWSSSVAASPYYGVYTWTNNLAGYSAATASDIDAAIDAYTQNCAGANISNAGATFKTWLTDIGARVADPLSYKDGRNVARTGTWWPGAYQQN